MNVVAEAFKQKLDILADAAQFDASCSTSGSDRAAVKGGLGSTAPAGICHSWANDGRCVSLLKVLMTNVCLYDCAYCRNRRSNDIPRASFSKADLVNLVMEFYRRNYIEGLFLSSGIFASPDTTMEKMVSVIRSLRRDEGFNGYIHMKTIPGASRELIREAGRWADRLSVNIELPSGTSLERLAPDKTKEAIFGSMGSILTEQLDQCRSPLPVYGQEAGRIGANDLIRTPAQEPVPAMALAALRQSKNLYLPAGQTTQMVIGASPESDRQILMLTQKLYEKFGLKRVYYSAYVPVNHDKNLPVPPIPLRREHRLYQADWLFRFYQFDAPEILDQSSPFLDDALDPKAAWALRHPEYFPVNILKAPLPVLLRIPGIGPLSARRIIAARKHSVLRIEQLGALGVVMKRAKYFVSAAEKNPFIPTRDFSLLRPMLTDGGGPRQGAGQLEFDFFPEAGNELSGPRAAIPLIKEYF